MRPTVRLQPEIVSQKSKFERFYFFMFFLFKLFKQRLQAVIFLPLIVAVWILRCCRRLLATIECEREKLLLGPRSQIGQVLDIEYNLEIKIMVFNITQDINLTRV